MSLESLFGPGSIAVIGASRTPGKIGYEIFSNLLKSNFKGRVFPVNPNVTSVLGVVSYKSIRHIEAGVDLAIIAVPAAGVPEVLAECIEKKVKSVIIISSGFSETGEAGAKLEKSIKDLVGKSKIRVLGPNVLGFYDGHTGLNATFLPKERIRIPERGQISMISQSGSVGSTVLDVIGAHGIGVSKFVSYGNAMDIDESDLISYLANDSSTKVIAAFIEGLKDGKKFVDAVRAVGRRKPIIVLKGGKTESGAKAAASHTGSMAGSYKVYSSVFKQLGIVEARNWQEFLDYSKTFLQPLPKGDRIAVITDGGGFGILSTDEAEKYGLNLPEPSAKLKSSLQSASSHVGSLRNPIDLTADATVERYARVMEAVLNSGEYDGVVVVVGFQVPTLETTLVDAIERMKSFGKPILCFSTGSDFSRKLIKELESKGIPVYDSPERAVRAMAALVNYSKIAQKK